MLFSFCSCKNEPIKKMGLSERNSFLENLYDEDNELRTKADQVRDNSDTFKQLIDSMNIVNKEEHLPQLLDYLSMYDYPDKEAYSVKANMTPWLILQHCMDGKVRLKHASIIVDANKSGHLDDDKLWLYLVRTYSLKGRRQNQMDWSVSNNNYEKVNFILMDSLGIKF